jgi:hypothetical protein
MLDYCDWLLHSINEGHNFVSYNSFSDELRFTNIIDRIPDINLNKCTSSDAKSLSGKESFGVDVWIGIVGTRIIGPIPFQGRLNKYQNI